jgi:hypothetical protein
VLQVPEGDSLFDHSKTIDVSIAAALWTRLGPLEKPAKSYFQFEMAAEAATCGCFSGPPEDWQTDDYFVEQRVLGVNPCAMKRLSNLSAADQVCLGGGGSLGLLCVAF